MPLPITLSIDKGICMLQEKIGLRSGFFSALYDEDDWSFVIKLHALLEAACTHLLMFHFREPELNDVISRLELSGRTVGKTVFLGKLGLLGKEYRRFVAALSELRNDLVHDIRNSEFSLREFVQSLDPIAIRNFAVSRGLAPVLALQIAGGRPAIPGELQRLMHRMATDNPLWG